MIDDVFCKIISGELKSDFVYQDDDFIVLNDIHPQAPIHLLVVPKKHLLGIEDGDAELLGKALRLADKMGHEKAEGKGYRLIINEGEHGGKMVPHLHIHVLGGKKLGPKIVKD